MSKTRCPRHDDDTPSCEVYENGAYCFSGCGFIPLSELGLSNETRPKNRYREDLSTKRSYIASLPRATFRGFEFPYDERGFYLLFPESEYYKQRVFSPGDGPKYRNPSGHAQPLFRTRVLSLQRLLLVEGEINSLSLALAFPEYDVVSPGSATEFGSKKTVFSLTQLPYYDTIIIVVDRDAAGAGAAINAKVAMNNRAKEVHIVFLEEDANQIHNEKGLTALRETIEDKMPSKV